MPAEAKERSRPSTVLLVPGSRRKSAPRSRQASSAISGAWAINPMASIDHDDYADAFEEAARDDGEFANAVQSAVLERREIDPKFDLVLDPDVALNKWPASLDAASEHSLARFLQQSVFEKLKFRQSAVAGWTLARAVNCGALYSGAVDVHAADLDCYVGTFREVFEPLVAASHPDFLKGHLHNLDVDLTNLSALSASARAKVAGCRLSVSRNLSFVAMNPMGTKESRQQVETLMTKVFENFSNDFGGQYVSLSTMSDAQRDALVAEQLFFGGDIQLAAAGINQFWPWGRGVFYNHSKTFFVWLNHSDHLVIFSVSSGFDVVSAAQRLFDGLNMIETELRNLTSLADFFLTDPSLGSISCCPSNLGSGLHANVRMLVPSVARGAFEPLVLRCAAKLAGESEVMDCIEISSTRRLGVSVRDSINDVLLAVNHLAALEDELLQPKRVTMDVGISMLAAQPQLGTTCPSCKTLLPRHSTGTEMEACSACMTEFQPVELSVLECPYCFSWNQDLSSSTVTCTVCTTTFLVDNGDNAQRTEALGTGDTGWTFQREETGSFAYYLVCGVSFLCAPLALLHLLGGLLFALLCFVPVSFLAHARPPAPLSQEGKKHGLDWAQICGRQGMCSLWRLCAGNCAQWWITKLFITNFCMFPRKLHQFKYRVRLPQGVNAFDAIVQECFCTQRPVGFMATQELHILLTTKSRLAALVPGTPWVLLGNITHFSRESLQVQLRASHILGPAVLGLSLESDAVLTLTIEYALNPVSLAVLRAAHRSLATLASQVEAHIQQLHRSSSPLSSPRYSLPEAESALHVPLTHTVLPVGFDDPPRRHCARSVLHAAVWPWLFLLVSLPYLLVGCLWWFARTLYLFVGLSLTYVCWCPAPLPMLAPSPQGLKVKPSSIPWGVRLDVSFWLEGPLVVRRAMGLAWAWAGELDPLPMGDHTLRRLLTCTAAGRLLVNDSASQSLEWKLGNEGCRCESDGTVTRLNVNQTLLYPQDPSWALSKQQFICNIGSTLLHKFHERSDFLFPQLAASALYKEVKGDSILFFLLAPHLRFVLNLDAVRDSCYGGCLPYSVSRQTMPSLCDEKGEDEAFKGWPPHFVLPYSQAHFTNYDKFLSSYYVVIREFVARVYPDIKSERSYPPFMAALAQRLPIVLSMGPVDLLATLIWQVSVVHSTERVIFCQYAKYFAMGSEQARGHSLVRIQSFTSVFLRPLGLAQLVECEHEFPVSHLRRCDHAFRQALQMNDTNLLEHGIQLISLAELHSCMTC